MTAGGAPAGAAMRRRGGRAAGVGPAGGAGAGGLRRLGGGYVSMLRFDLASVRLWLPFTVLLQVLMGAGMAMIYGFYMPGRTPQATQYLVTGAPALSLIPVGMVLLPQLVGERRDSGTFDFVWSLPVPRPVAVASMLTVFSLVALPGVAATLLLAWWRYGITLSVSWTIVPALVLTALMSCSVGMGLAHGVANSVAVNLITNMLIFLVLMFTPIAMPTANFPGWLVDAHRGLPFLPMASVIRGGLTDGVVGDLGVSYAVLAAWTAAGWAVTAWVIGRRH